MKSFDYIEWYSRRPTWLRILLVPVLLAVTIVHSVIVFAIFFPLILIAAPLLWIKDRMRRRRFWNRLRQRNQVALWSDVERSLRAGKGVLIAEIAMDGFENCWWIDRLRSEVDPARAVPSWTDFEERSLDLFESDADFNALELWSIQRLTAYETTAKAVVVTWPQIAGLADDLKRDSILAVDWLCKGNLSERLR